MVYVKRGLMIPETGKWEFTIMVFVVDINGRPRSLQRKRCFLHLMPYRMTVCAAQYGQAGLDVSSLRSIMVTAFSNEEISSSESLLIWMISYS